MKIDSIEKEPDFTDKNREILANLYKKINNSGILDKLRSDNIDPELSNIIFDFINKSYQILDVFFNIPIQPSDECLPPNQAMGNNDISFLMSALISRDVISLYWPYVILNVQAKVSQKFRLQYRFFMLKKIWNKLKSITADASKKMKILNNKMMPSMRISHMKKCNDDCLISVFEVLSDLVEALGDVFQWQSLK